jgi:hypothetical protein
MTKPTIREHNTETDEVIDREMTDEEFAFYQSSKLEADNLIAAEATKAVEKAALLEKLGISEDEAKLLLS